MPEQSPRADVEAIGPAARDEPYGEGFAAVYAGERYALFSRRLAKFALSLIEAHGAPGPVLLDLACGAAAGTLVFAQAGYEATGVDRSTTILAHAEQRLQAGGAAVRLLQQEMQQLSLPHQVDVVTCLFDSLNYLLSEEELGAVFARVAATLRPNGLFVFDMNTVHGLSTRWGSGDCVATARRDVMEINRYRMDTTTCINTVHTTTFVRQGELFARYDEVHRERGYAVATVHSLLVDAGLSVVASHALYDRLLGANELQPLSDQAGRMVIVARR